MNLFFSKIIFRSGTGGTDWDEDSEHLNEYLDDVDPNLLIETK